MTVMGLQNYNFEEDARRIASKFCGLVARVFERERTIVEKYDVSNSSVETTSKLSYGYNSNEIGFGWTNAVYLNLTKML